MLTTRGRGVLGLGLGVTLAAWAFGSKPLYPVATGLLLVVALAWVWVRLANRPFRVQRGWGDTEHVEGDDVPVVVQIDATAGVPPAAAALVGRVGRLGEQRDGPPGDRGPVRACAAPGGGADRRRAGGGK